MHVPFAFRYALALTGAVLVLFASVSAVHAHSSAEEVVTDIQSRERYLEVVDRAPPPFVLADTEGRRVALSDFDGKVVVLNFIYARCYDVCPLHSALLAEAQRMLREAGLVEGVQFVTIATDTEEAAATSELMRQHGPTHGLDPANWVFLYRSAETPDTTVWLAERYGLKFTATPEGSQMHGVVTHVIDQGGHMRARFHGLKFAPENLVFYVAALVHDASAHPEPTPGGNATAAAASASPEFWRRLAIGLLGLLVAVSAAYALYRGRVKS